MFPCEWTDVQRNKANGFQRAVQTGNQEGKLRAENWDVTDTLTCNCQGYVPLTEIYRIYHRKPFPHGTDPAKLHGWIRTFSIAWVIQASLR